jgi:hypothetical protein
LLILRVKTTENKILYTSTVGGWGGRGEEIS